jgi:hypothetical protein
MAKLPTAACVLVGEFRSASRDGFSFASASGLRSDKITQFNAAVKTIR